MAKFVWILFLLSVSEAVRTVGAENLQKALQSRYMKQFPMSTCTCILLERYGDQLVVEQKKALAVWEEQLCASRVVDGEAVRVRRAEAFVRLQEFLAKFAAEIVLLQKPDLRSVVMSYQAQKHTEWTQAKTFFRRDFVFRTVEEEDLLQDWELVLCDTSVAVLPRVEQNLERALALESVAFLPRLQRCVERVVCF